jgi:hypothetical protein
MKWSDPGLTVFVLTAGAEAATKEAALGALAQLAVGHPALASATFYIGDDSGEGVGCASCDAVLMRCARRRRAVHVRVLGAAAAVREGARAGRHL